MRPHKLTLEGFTSFRDKVELDFTGLDLFAITGPTGAGKSSLIDAICFALYGQVPRVGDDYKQLISHGAERLSVMLEFGVGKERYRIARTARPDKPSQQRLERITADAAEPLADRVKEIRTEVDRILGLDYDGFTRSVVLPQGQFDAFLKGEPKERRKILVALLNLTVYERMQQLANQRSSAAKTEADFIKRQLETDFANATQEALDQKRSELETAEACARQAEAALAALADASQIAQQVRSHRKDQASLAKDHADETARRERAQATLDGAGQAKKTLDQELDKLQAQKDAHGFDEARHTTLVAAKPLADQLVSLQQGHTKATKAVADKRRDLDEARKAVLQEEKALPALEKAEADARAAETAARAEKEEAHRDHAALAIRQGLKPGDPCPVCAQAVKTVPKGKAPALDAVDTKLKKAEAAARAAQDKLQQARLTQEQRRAKAESLERELEQAEAREKEAKTLAGDVQAALAKAGFKADDDASTLVKTIQRELQTLDAAKKLRAETEAKLKEIDQKRARLDAEVAAAAAQRDVLQARLQELEKKAVAADKALEEAQYALGKLAATRRLDEAPPASNRKRRSRRRRVPEEPSAKETPRPPSRKSPPSPTKSRRPRSPWSAPPPWWKSAPPSTRNRPSPRPCPTTSRPTSSSPGSRKKPSPASPKAAPDTSPSSPRTATPCASAPAPKSPPPAPSKTSSSSTPGTATASARSELSPAAKPSSPPSPWPWPSPKASPS